MCFNVGRDLIMVDVLHCWQGSYNGRCASLLAGILLWSMCFIAGRNLIMIDVLNCWPGSYNGRCAELLAGIL